MNDPSVTQNLEMQTLARGRSSANADDRYQLLLRGIESIKDYSIILLDPQGRVITWNEGAKRIKGYSEEEILGQSIAKFYKEDAVLLHLPESDLQQAKEKGHLEDEGWRVRKNGSSFWANVIITPIYNDLSQHIGFMKVTRDLTERKEAELALAKSERNYRTIASHAPNGIFHSDPNGHLIYVNERACEIMGLTFEQALGEGWVKAIHPADKEEVINAWTQALRSKENFKKEFRFRNPEGKITWVIGHGRPELDEKDQVKSYVQVVTDINDRKALEEKERELLIASQEAELELRKRAQDAEENQKKLSALMNMVCHGVRNPMTGMSGNNEFITADIELIRKLLEEFQQQLPGKFKESLRTRLAAMSEYTKAISECIKQQKEIADSMLDLARLEANLMGVDITSFRPKEVIRSIALSCKGQLAAKGLKLLLWLPDEDIVIKSDSNRFIQIVSNLLNNAIKFTPAGKISISLNLQGIAPHNYLHIVVEDSGIGMSEDELQRIFDPFTQANSKIVHNYGGSGLGLSISKKLVELLGGILSVESTQGKGTKFTFTVHCEQLTQEERKDFDSHKEQIVVELVSDKPQTKKNILIVEDNLVNQKVTVKFFQEKGFSYEIANNGREALEKWKPGKFDLIFMDIKMPEMDGLEATQAIRQQEALLKCTPVPIIGLSADAMEEQKQQASQAGMNDYIVKPYNKAQIYQKIDQWTELTTKLTPPETPLSQLPTAPTLFQLSHPPPYTEVDTEEKSLESTVKKTKLNPKEH